MLPILRNTDVLWKFRLAVLLVALDFNTTLIAKVVSW